MSVTPAALRRLMKEINELQRSPPEGVRIQTSEDSLLDIVGLVEGPAGTPYAGGYFKVKFQFTEEFPAAPPKCWFATKIFHPNVSSAGEICVNTLKKDWKPQYGIAHILITIKCLLIYPNPESALDEEAGKLLLENYDTYASRAKLITSVHATPKRRPVEFDTPSASTSTAEGASPPSGAATTASPSTTSPKPPSTKSSPELTATPSLTISASVSTTGLKSATSTPNVLKLSSPSNMAEKEKDGVKEKESRQHSPSPLATADANVATTKSSSMAALGKMDGVQSGLQNKAVKRAATGGTVTDAQKRKKALKRL